MILEQPNLHIHGIKFWPNLNKLVIIDFKHLLFKSNPRKTLELPSMVSSAYCKTVFQEATYKQLQSTSSLLISIKAKNCKCIHRTPWNSWQKVNFANSSKVQIQRFSIFVYQFGLQRLVSISTFTGWELQLPAALSSQQYQPKLTFPVCDIW